MKKLSLAALCILITLLSNAQAPVIQWQRTYGGSKFDMASAICPSIGDSAFIVVGGTESGDGDVTGYHAGTTGQNDFWAVKIAWNSGMFWQKCYGGVYEDYARSVQQTTDGGYIIAGQTESKDGDVTNWKGATDIWVVKTNGSGALTWEKDFGGTADDVAYSIQQLTEGGYVVAGYTQSSDGDASSFHWGGEDFWVIKLDDAGNKLWQRNYGGAGADEAHSIYQTADSGFIVVGYTTSSDANVTGHHGSTVSNKDFWVLRIDKSDAIKWKKCYGGSSNDEAWAVQQTSDGGFIVAGSTESNDGDLTAHYPGSGSNQDAWILKLDDTGKIIWQKNYGGGYDDVAYSIQQTTDSGYIVAGYSSSVDGDVTGHISGRDVWVLKLNASGTIVWEQCYGGGSDDVASSIRQVTDSTYILAGYTNSYNHEVTANHGIVDFWVVKLAPTVGVSTITANASDIKVYPTLTNGVINIDLPQGYERAHIRLINTLGQDIHFTEDRTGLSRSVRLYDSPAGMYILQVLNNGIMSTYKIMKE